MYFVGIDDSGRVLCDKELDESAMEERGGEGEARKDGIGGKGCFFFQSCILEFAVTCLPT